MDQENVQDAFPMAYRGDHDHLNLLQGVQHWLEHCAKKVEKMSTQKQQVHNLIYKILMKIAGLKEPCQ